MMRMLLPVLLLIVGLGGGVGAGLMLGGNEAEASDTEDHAGDEAHTDDAAHAGDGEDPEEANDSELSRVEPAGDGTEFVRINNQFVVPIVRNGAVRSLVVMSLSLEVNTGGNAAVFTQEPRLRDSFLRVMFAHANSGGFDGRFTESDAMAPLRGALREAAQQTLGRDMIHDVLITDIIRQDA